MAKLALLLLVVISTSYVHPQTENYRLPTNVVPSHYDIKYTFGNGVFDGTDVTFRADVTITVQVTTLTQTIQLHSSPSMVISSLVMYENISGQLPEERLPIRTSHIHNSNTEILTISRTEGTEGFTPSNYDLVFVIDGQISTTEMFGIYRSSYQEAGVTKYLITTQFQPTFARRAFPCFDEPAFKATFTLSFATLPSTVSVLANTQVTAGSLIFPQTPIMSTYLVAFTISEFTCNQAILVDTVQSRICSKQEAAQQRAWADATAPQLLGALNVYTGINYNENMNKLDHVAIPDFAAGAMENWGLSTYREQILLYDENESTARDQQITTTVLSHEIAHQWFGNLVTVQWWSELFLNEGFANYFEYFASHLVYPAWQLDRQYVVNTLQAALRSDEGNAMPLQNNNVASPTEVLLMFGTISYSKGGSIFRMVEHIMGTNKFKEGLTAYLTTYKQSNTVPENLWDSLNTVIDRTYSNLPATLTLSQVMENWVKMSGFPLLEVTVVNGVVTIKQKQFMANGSDSSVRWFVPISYTTSVDITKFQSTNPQQWLTQGVNEITFNLPEGATWIILNNRQTGYYRVTYDTATWDSINLALKAQNFSDIDELNRAGIVDDLFSLAKINNISYTRVFNIVDFLKQDVSYFPWIPAFTGFSYLLDRVGLRSEIGQRMSTHILENMETLYQASLFDNINVADHVFTLKQTLALRWACYLGNPDCIQKSKDLFAVYKLDNTQRPNPNLRSIVYCTAMRESTDDTDWDTLWTAYTASTTEKDVLLSALACTKNEIRLQELLAHSLTESVRSQDRLTIFQNVVNNPDGIGAARTFVNQQFVAISQQYQALNAISSILQLLASKVTSQTELDEFQTFVSTSLPEAYVTEGQRAVTRATENVEWLLANEEDLRTFYEIPTTTPTPGAGNALSGRYVEIILLMCISYILL